MIREYDLNARHFVRHFNNDDVSNAGIAALLRSVARYIELNEREWVASIDYQSDGDSFASVNLVLT